MRRSIRYILTTCIMFFWAIAWTCADFRIRPSTPGSSGCLLALMGDIREAPFHAAYILFSVIAALAMWSLARRFSPHPLWATLLFLAVPAFVVNGNSLESDLPFLAFWMAAVACFAAGRWTWAAIAMALAALGAFQAVFLTPILAVYVWIYRRRDRTAWLLTLVPPATILAWELWERWSSGALPASVAAGYMNSYGLQAIANKLRNAAALTVHSCFMVFPALLPGATLLAWKRRDRDTAFLAAWIALFFGGAVAVFFAGSARYLLPMAAPVALLVSRLRSAVASPGIRRPDGAQPGPRHRELPALGWLPALRPADPTGDCGPSSVY